MAPFRRILVAIDSQATTPFPFEAAIQLSRDLAAKLRVVELVDLWALEDAEASGIYAMPVENDLVRMAWQRLATAESQARVRGVSVETAVLPIYDAAIGDTIADEARRWRADLIILGASGRPGLEGLIPSSIAEAIATTATIPVLLVPSGYRLRLRA